MKTIILSYLLLSLFSTFAQQDNTNNIPSVYKSYENVNGSVQTKIVTHPEVYDLNNKPVFNSETQKDIVLGNSNVRWSFTEAAAIGDRNSVNGTGLNEVVGWGLNAERISLYGNTNNTPVWEYPTDPSTNINHVVISDTGGIIASGSYKNVYMFNQQSSTPFFNLNLSAFPQNVVAGPVDITNNGGFMIASINANVSGDSSFIMGFSKDSTGPVWQIKVGQSGGAGGSGIQGVNIAGSDSLAVVNTYGAFYIIRTYTGQVIYQDLINPLSSSGTQFPQAISRNGNYVATINYRGYVRVFQRSGNSYNLLWQHQEPPGTYYNWMTAVDFTSDGQYLACGTLQFVTSSSYDGKVKLFRTTNSTPIWTYSGCGDQVTRVAFSKNGNILAASTYGDMGNVNNDLLVWKTSTETSAPIFGVNTVGSLFWCNVSNNGSTVITSGKLVHARIMGSGGLAYNIFIDTNDTPVGVPGINNQPVSYSLKQNYPNPFNPSTQIDYELAGDGFVRLTVFDITGREISKLVNKFQRAGIHAVMFDAENLSSGLYFYKIETNGFTETRKMTLLK